MAIIMYMEWKGVSREQYDALRKKVNWETEAPDGGMFHVAAITDSGLRVTDLWESAAAFQSFIENRVMPGVKEIGIPGEPHVEIYPVHRLFTPGFKPL